MSNATTALSKGQESALANILDQAEAEGAVVNDLFPQLNKKLRDMGAGSLVIGEVLAYNRDAAPSALNANEAADVMTIKDLADGKRYNFFASNAGTKAKFRPIKKGDWILVLYGGSHPSETKGHNDWQDYRNVIFTDRAQAEKRGAEILTALAAGN